MTRVNTATYLTVIGNLIHFWYEFLCNDSCVLL